MNPIQRAIGKTGVVVIAEAGVNHNGDPALARALADAAKASGADCVKFQTFTAEGLVTAGTPKVPYQRRDDGESETHHAMLEKLELSRAAHVELKAHCDAIGIEFCSTPYSVDDAKFLRDLGVRFMKTASADIVDTALHEFLATTDLPVIVSTGMSTLGEIEEVVEIYDRCDRRDGLVLLHCVCNYPAKVANANLQALQTLAAAFGCTVGFSDHTSTATASIAAVALGAEVIERHLTTDKGLPGPDHQASCDPREFRMLTDMIREAEAALGSPIKRVVDEEWDMRRISRKSLVAKVDIAAGTSPGVEAFTTKRPGTGIAPKHLRTLALRRARRDIAAGTLLAWEMFGE